MKLPAFPIFASIFLCLALMGCLWSPSADSSSSTDGPLIGTFWESSEPVFCDGFCPDSRYTLYVFSENGKFTKIDSIFRVVDQKTTIKVDSLVGHFERSGNQVYFTDLISYPIRTTPMYDQSDSVYTYTFLLPWRKGPTRFEILRLDRRAMVLKWAGRSPLIGGPTKPDTFTKPDSVIWSGYRP